MYEIDKWRKSLHSEKTKTIGKVKEDKHGGGTGKDKIGACKKE